MFHSLRSFMMVAKPGVPKSGGYSMSKLSVSNSPNYSDERRWDLIRLDQAFNQCVIRLPRNANQSFSISDAYTPKHDNPP